MGKSAMDDVSAVVNTARNSFKREITLPLEFRRSQLKALLKLVDENFDTLVDALGTDFRKPSSEAILAEVEATKNHVKRAIYEIRSWVKPEKINSSILLLLDKTFVFPQPYGVVLILGPWNFPFNSVMEPLIGAIAAGNCAIIKPSEKAPAVAKLLQDLVPQYMHQECFHVVSGDVDLTTELLKERFDYIFYTGSTTVGQKVREAANKHLTPVTLELGGKCPVYVDDEVDMEVAAKRIIWGKMLNLGQTCVGPDYVLCSKRIEQPFVEIARKVILEFFGANPEASPDLARIVNEFHFQRIVNYLSSGKIALGGDYNSEDNYIAPTILVDVKESDPIMQEEIFGPVLPLITVRTAEEAIQFINKREKPLTLYLFTKNEHIFNRFLTATSSGTLSVNDTMIHPFVDSLPFGGVGKSGMGIYHGKYSFETFSHKRAVIARTLNAFVELLGKVRYPPYTDFKTRFMMKVLKTRRNPIPSFAPQLLVFILGMVTALALKELVQVIVNLSNPSP